MCCFVEGPVLCLRSEWYTNAIVIITIIDASTADDPILTRIGTLSFLIQPAGGLEMEGNITLPTKTTAPFYVNGTWVSVWHPLRLLTRCGNAGAVVGVQGKIEPPPEIVSAVAHSGGEPEGGYGPGSKDYLIITFSRWVDSLPVATQPELSSVVEFVPPLFDVNFTGCERPARSLADPSIERAVSPAPPCVSSP